MVSKENASIYFLEKMCMNSQERRTQSKGRERALEAESPGSVFRLWDLDHVSWSLCLRFLKVDMRIKPSNGKSSNRDKT